MIKCLHHLRQAIGKNDGGMNRIRKVLEQSPTFIKSRPPLNSGKAEDIIKTAKQEKD